MQQMKEIVKKIGVREYTGWSADGLHRAAARMGTPHEKIVTPHQAKVVHELVHQWLVRKCGDAGAELNCWAFDHEEQAPGSWALTSEGYLHDWAIAAADELQGQVAGVFLEPILGCILGVYPR